jgi:hypothetical protein
MEPERRLAAIAALALLVTMFFPWYGLQSVDRKTGAIYSHSISAFGDVSFVEAAIFLVAAGVIAMLLARAEGRRFQLPGGDGTIVMLAGSWAGLLIFYRVFDRPTGSGYPVGIEWGFFLAFVAAGSLAYAGWRMRASERPGPPLTRPARRRPPAERATADADPDSAEVVRASRERSPVAVPAREPTPAPASTASRESTAPRAPVQSHRSAPPSEPAPSRRPTSPPQPTPSRGPARARERSPYPPAPEQLSFEDPPTTRPQ